MGFDIVPGTDGLTLDDVAHILIPGRGRDDSGFGLNRGALDRIDIAEALYEQVLGARNGKIVCSGYKSPADSKGRDWSPPSSPSDRFRGMPEADMMRDELRRRGISERVIAVERRSIDTVTNFLRSELEGHFGDARPVAIIAQCAHLRRMLSIIAPRTLRRPYLGVIVPEALVEGENPLIVMASRLLVTRLPEDPERAITVATKRAERLWSIGRAAGLRHYH